jgi:iron complex transport system substrate-binding protein
MRKITALILSLVMIISLVACGAPTDPSGGTTLSPVNGNTPSVADEAKTRIVIDTWGREVEIPSTVETIICLGSSAPRLAAYLDTVDMFVGAEEYIKDGVNVRRDYNPVHYETLIKLPFVGQGGGSGQNNGYPEEIIKVAPDVIIAGFTQEAADELQAQTNIPVVAVRVGSTLDSFRTCMKITADVVGAQERCEMLLAYVDDMMADLNARTANISDDEKLRAYAGAITWNGRRGFSGTYSVFDTFDAINAINVAANAGIDGFYEADLEAVLLWDPDVIFLDPGNMDLVNEEYATNPDYFNSLRAVQEGQVYSMPSFNNAGTNFTYSFINTYYAGTVLFPEQFSDIDIAEKAGEILTTFLGKNTYDLMAGAGLYYGPITIGK